MNTCQLQLKMNIFFCISKSVLHAPVNLEFVLTGNVMNGPIGKQMVDTLVESQANVEVGIGTCIHRLMIHRLMIHNQ